MSIHIQKLTDKKHLVTLMLCIGLMQIAGYYLAVMLASRDGAMAVPQPDTLLYCQAARRIAEGHPFSFSAGTAVSTGTTSVLYPFILAIPYVLGATGDALIMAGFWLNALFYLVFLFGWGKAICNWIENPWARLTGAVLLALSGQPAFCAMAQSDIGCWMAVSALFAWGLSAGKPAIYGPVLIMAPWIRPEGMICVVALGIIMLIGRRIRFLRETCPHERTNLVILCLSMLSTAGVFTLNRILTGQAQFSSVANKGYFKTLPFTDAMIRAANDLLELVNGYLLGLATSMPRNFIFPVILAAAFIWMGLLVHRWRSHAHSLSVFLLAACGGVLTVAQSGWQGTNYDRYLAWILPIYILFLAEGLSYFTVKYRHRLPGALIPAGACFLFFSGSAFVSVYQLNQGATKTDRIRLFADEIAANIPPAASVGSFGASGIAYRLGQRPYHHLSGLYSPQFFVKTTAATFEILKNDPSTRFDYWLLLPENSTAVPTMYRTVCYGENALTGPDGYEMRKADWSAFDHAGMHHVVVPQGKNLVCRIDVGHEADEKAVDYEVIDRYGRPPTDPFLIIDKLAGKYAIDSARLLIGGDAATLPLQKGKDVFVVMRTYPRHTETRVHEGGKVSCEYEFANPLKLNVNIDGQALDPVSISYATNGFSEVSFTLPGRAIENTPCRLSLLGDHIASGYWFYQ